jgi:N-acylglucosamine 2-epimerase
VSATARTLIPQYTDEFIRIYCDGLLEDIIPFWIRHSVDREHGGFLTSLDRDGSVIDTDKAVWLQGRFVWMLSTLQNTVGQHGIEPRPEWLEIAQHGIDFLDAHCFDEDGRMFFLVTREGKPLRKRRYIFSETFTTIAFAAYAQATGDDALLQRAVDLFKLTLHYLETPGLLPPKTDPDTRPMKGIAVPMILIATAQVLREAGGDVELCNQTIDRCLDEIERDFMHPELSAVLEVVGPNGEFIDSYDGRTVTPGHAIEAAWFILDEAAHRNRDARLTQMGCTMLDWMWEMGWDTEYGGLFYFRDVTGRPVQEYWHDMKFWWPHNEAVIATLLAYRLTGDERYAHLHKLAHEWAFRHFPDAEYGEWFGYLHRDGSLSVPLKGNQWKGGFHVPRMYWKSWMILEEMKAESADG